MRPRSFVVVVVLIFKPCMCVYMKKSSAKITVYSFPRKNFKFFSGYVLAFMELLLWICLCPAHLNYMSN